jgi:glucose-6-phosphate-specific signal transduction histidine kinase
MEYATEVLMWLLAGTAAGIGLGEAIGRLRATKRREAGTKGRQ